MALSDKLQKTLASDRPQTLQAVIDGFEKQSFAFLFLLLMAVPALPLPTGGVTHVFEIVTMLLALELIAGRKNVWLPQRWLAVTLPGGIQNKALPKFIRFIRAVERHSKPRLAKMLDSDVALRIIGVVILLFTIFAFVAPPFSGLDTLPALGVVLVALALILGDFILLLVGLAAGSAGIALVLALGNIVFKLL